MKRLSFLRESAPSPVQLLLMVNVHRATLEALLGRNFY